MKYYYVSIYKKILLHHQAKIKADSPAEAQGIAISKRGKYKYKQISISHEAEYVDRWDPVNEKTK